jgi:hypothetical protein
MSIQKGMKLQKLMQFPKGMALTASYLQNQGFGPQLLARYKQSNWLKSIGDGAYVRHGDNVDWQGALAAIQSQLKLPVHCGARTALELQGYSHYVASTRRDVFLFGATGQKLPRWFERSNWSANVIYKMTNLFPNDLPESYVNFPAKDLTIRIASPERAAMEMLYHIPAKQGFDEAMLIMESLLTLRPALVQKLLEACNSVKVKRLFLYMSGATNLPFVAKLDLAKVNLGKGDRTVVKGGRLDPKYRITVSRRSEA